MKNKYELTGQHDEDYFLSLDDMSQEFFEVLMACHQQGECESYCQDAREFFTLKNHEAAADYLIDCGIERERFYIEDEEGQQSLDTEAVELYYLWILAGDIRERKLEQN